MKEGIQRLKLHIGGEFLFSTIIFSTFNCLFFNNHSQIIQVFLPKGEIPIAKNDRLSNRSRPFQDRRHLKRNLQKPDDLFVHISFFPVIRRFRPVSDFVFDISRVSKVGRNR